MTRPDYLIPLFASVSNLTGVGGHLAKTFGRLGIERVMDLVYHLPTGLNRYPLRTSLSDSPTGGALAIVVTVVEHVIASRPGKPYKIYVTDSKGLGLELTFFRAYPKTLQEKFPVGAQRLIAGTVDTYMGQYRMTHPDKVLPPGIAETWSEVEPTYPLTAGLTQGQAQKFTKDALKRLPTLPEWIPADVLQSHGWTSWKESLLKTHAPQTEADLEVWSPARERLAFDEMLAQQLSLKLVRTQNQMRPGRTRKGTGVVKDQILKTFGYPLTASQVTVLSEIEGDLASPSKMMRLLQGDVGSGKTLVSLLAIASAIESGCQAALLVPTEVLANQHYATLQKLCSDTPLRIELLTGSIKGKKRKEIYEALAMGQIDLLVGTHALIQEAVEFKNLGFVVIDEQHRFGVEQRLKLTQKGVDVDILIMTATPIPRTLMLTSYGDLEISKMTEKPCNRKDISTRILSSQRIPEVCEGLRRVFERGEKCYWVCPLIEESEAFDLAAAVSRYEELKEIFGENTVRLMHGQMTPDEKSQVMDDFKYGDVKLLVATTVIEVGVDVPQATAIIIERAERFGLSQLHQLRGRVGRNDLECFCLLLYGQPFTTQAQDRLKIMRDTNDGFLIAEEDLRLRGGGDLMGTRQSGLPGYRVADPLFQSALLTEAHALAETIYREDPLLTSPQGQALRVLLQLFECDKSATLLRQAA